MQSASESAAHGNAPATAAGDWRAEIVADPGRIDAALWNALLALQACPTPFMRLEYLAALHASASAVPRTGWTPQYLLLWDGAELAAACPLYLKEHSYGEYVFDWAWARAYAEHGLDYYPKALVAVPFTPVPGSRLLARDAAARAALLRTLLQACTDNGLSSLHVLYGDATDVAACEEAGLMLRQQVQFHWKNTRPPRSAAAPAALPPEGAFAPWDGPAALMRPPRSPAARGPLALQAAEPPQSAPLRAVQARTGEPGAAALSPSGALTALGRPGGGSGNGEAPVVGTEVARPFTDFEDFLASLARDKRKKIRQERRRVADAGVRVRWARGADITAADWAFFYRCYERTYLEHGNAPYLTPAFFERMARDLPQAWLLFVAERDGRDIGASLIALDASADAPAGGGVAYGRYWGALERVDCLHFELCYYAPLDWCIRHGIARFEGGAQGEHKMARALLPVVTHSAHWLAQPAFARAVARFLEREDEAVAGYLDDLRARSPFGHAPRR